MEDLKRHQKRAIKLVASLQWAISFGDKKWEENVHNLLMKLCKQENLDLKKTIRWAKDWLKSHPVEAAKYLPY